MSHLHTTRPPEAQPRRADDGPRETTTTTGDLLTPDGLRRTKLQAQQDARREQAQTIGLELLTHALKDPAAFLAQMREAGMFAPEDERLCGSFEEARDQLVAQWVERDARELAEHLEHPGAPNDLLKLWLEVGRPDGAWTWVHGPYGCGKTWQAAQLIRALHAEAGRSVLRESRPSMWAPHLLTATAACTATYTIESDMLASLRPSAEAPRTLSWWASRPLLIIDEACAGQITEWGEEHLFGVYDRRYRAKRPTVFLSNVRPEDAGAPHAWGSGRLASRLKQRLGGEAMPWAVELAGDWRRGGGR